jgi:hypothetical protein
MMSMPESFGYALAFIGLLFLSVLYLWQTPVRKRQPANKTGPRPDTLTGRNK